MTAIGSASFARGRRCLGYSLRQRCGARYASPVLGPVEPTHSSAFAPLQQQRRWWYDVDANRRSQSWDKPAVTGTKYVFIRQHVPMVMLQNVRGLGKKGQIVNVKRGYARHQLVPKGLAVFGTWENIDAYADPALVEDPALKARVASERGRLPFDWVDDVRLEFIRWAREDELNTLLEPITVWDILQSLSTDHELDLLPGNLDLPEDGIARVGDHQVPVKIPFRSPDMAAGRYTISVSAIAQQSLQEELRREEMAKAVKESIRFQLPQKGGAVRGRTEEDIFADEEELSD